MITTIPKIFIIESLTFEDEKAKRFEGKFLSHILKLGNIDFDYYYIRTKKEFQEVLMIFNSSNYRYLHLSCHGDKEGLATTLDDISYDEFSFLTKNHLENRRLFLSACSATNRSFAESLIPSTNCLSLIGPAIDIKFNDAAIIWASFYHLIFKENCKGMNRSEILPVLKSLVQTFQVQMNYFSASKIDKTGVRGTIIKFKISPKLIELGE
jgi:hypothetical protein